MSQLGKTYNIGFQLNAMRGSGFDSTFSKAQQEFSRLGKEIQSLSKIQSDISAYQKQQTAVESTRAKLENLQKQYDLLQKEIGETNGPTAALERESAKLDQRIQDTTNALERQEAKLQATGNRLKEAKVDTGDLTTASARLSSQLEELRKEQEEAAKGAQTFGEKTAGAFEAVQQVLAAAGVAVALNEVCQALWECADASMEFETAMAGVQRTVGGSEADIAALGENFKDLSTRIPITTSELAKIAETAGQLGIARDAVGEFTEVMAMLGTTTDLTADTAASMLAQFANITGVTDYRRLGSAVADLGDATATTASKVVEMSQGMAATAHLAGMSETDILAIAAAVGSLGIESQAGSTAMSTLISTLYKAVETGDGLADFAAVANMSAAQFKTAWGTDAVGAMNAFIQGLNDTERNGRSAVVILDELGITNVRQTKAVLGLASAGDLLSGTIAQANAAWNENTALQAKANVMYSTTESQLTMMQNAYNNLKIAIGDSYTPALEDAYAVGTDVLAGMTRFVQEHPAAVRAVTAFTGVALTAVTAITAVNAAIKVFKALDMAAAFASVPGIAVMAAGGIAALAAAAWQLADVSSEALDAWDALTDAHRDALQTYQDSAAAIDSEAENTLGLLNSLRELSGQSEKTAADQAQIAKICEQINAAVPDLSLSYDAQADSLTGLTGSLDSYIESLYQVQRQEKDVARLVELRGSIEETGAALEEAAAKADELQAEFDRMAAEGSDVFGIQQELYAYQIRVRELTDLLAEEQSEYDRLTDSVNEYSETQREAADTAPALEGALASVRSEMGLLIASYRDAYDDAYESISGQMGLFETMSVKVDTSINGMIASLESQVSYMATYSENLRQAAEMGLSEGLLAQLSDGSTQSAAYLQAIVKGGEEKVAELNAAFAKVEEGKEDFSNTVAEMQTGLEEALGTMEQDVLESVQAMELPDEAAESARNTIQAFIDEANDMLPWVQSAYAQLGQAAANSLGLDNSRRYIEPMTGTELWERRFAGGFASGTDSAPPGWAWVGEEGPELIHMRGGEQILPAEVSRKFAILAETANLPYDSAGFLPYSSAAEAATGTEDFVPAPLSVSVAETKPVPDAAPTPDGGAPPAQINVELHLHIDSGAPPETVAAWRDYANSGELDEYIIEVMRKADRDARRRAY